MALQFPEGLLLYACVIADIVEEYVKELLFPLYQEKIYYNYYYYIDYVDKPSF